MSGDFLETMAAHSAERAAAIGPIDDAELDKPLVPLQLGEFDVIAEIKDRSPAEGVAQAAAAIDNGSAESFLDGLRAHFDAA